MKKFLISAILFALLSITVFAVPDANPTVRVGLYYGNDAMISANLQNAEGFGYRFGYFDSEHNFIAEHEETGTKFISMLKDSNIYFSDGKFYESGAPSGSTLIGAFHLQTSDTFESQRDAVLSATSLQLQGIPAFVCVQNGEYRIRIGSYASLTAAQSDIIRYTSLGTCTPVGNSRKCVTVVDTNTGKILFEYDSDAYLAVYPVSNNGTAPLTWFKGYKYYGAFQYIRDGGNISVVNFVSMQDYTKGVIPYEMSASWPKEALKAQALCAKTYALYNYGKHGKNFDVCATTDCQVYRGANSANENSDLAVDETYGMYILYDGKPINAVFCSSNGGATEDSENVWSSALPYLRGVYDNNEDLDTCTNGRWSYEYSSDQLTYILNAKGYPCQKIVNMYVKEFTRMGNVKVLTMVDSTGKEFNFSKEKAKTILYSSTYKKYAHSQRFNVTRKGEAASASMMYVNQSSSVDFAYDTIFAIGASGQVVLPKSAVSIITANGVTVFDPNKKPAQQTTSTEATFVVSGTGWGHNVGLSQNGAKAMALSGYTAQDIINFYYTDIEIYEA